MPFSRLPQVAMEESLEEAQARKAAEKPLDQKDAAELAQVGAGWCWRWVLQQVLGGWLVLALGATAGAGRLAGGRVCCWALQLLGRGLGWAFRRREGGLWGT